ncbi:hypothetical protein TcWFU_004857 [Taenia crassiceps]|uniref:Uncharacterized protein n=1 Tax=Taenia crassiceps TaxID=6207 RepID=A0ABR4Q2P6_9CEST
MEYTEHEVESILIAVMHHCIHGFPLSLTLAIALALARPMPLSLPSATASLFPFSFPFPIPFPMPYPFIFAFALALRESLTPIMQQVVVTHLHREQQCRAPRPRAVMHVAVEAAQSRQWYSMSVYLFPPF